MAAAYRRALSRDPIVSQLQSYEIVEGDDFEIRTLDGFVGGGYEKFESSFEVNAEQLAKMTDDAWTEKLALELFGPLINEQHKLLLQRVSEAAEWSGNITNARGPLSGDTLLTMLRMTEISFGEDGRPEWPTLVVPEGTDLSKLKEIEGDPAFAAEEESILAVKYTDWRIRQSNRTLVD